ncbi:MAG: P-loop NTPase fold protein, partial [Bacteroidales bacterium]|nr:P-loop NTPase fold protein [Bacteroidales bacterium]
DCEKCVFVLAIDYDVVCRGVEAKYGKLSDDKAANENKGKSFFDKIIQVPFKMPVAEYNIQNYIKTCFKEIGITCEDSEISIYEDLIKRSIGANPRGMKRLFNAYLLLKIVVTDAVLESDKNKLLLFAVLCLQHAFEKTYEYLVRNRNELTGENLRLLENSDYQDVKTHLPEYAASEEEFSRLKPFMESFIRLINRDTDTNDINKDELANLVNVMGISSITSAGDESKPYRAKTEVKDIRELNIGGKDSAFLEKMISAVKAVGLDVRESMRNNKTVTIVFKNKNGAGTTFTEFYIQAKSYLVYCSGREKSVFETPEISAILERRGIKDIEPGHNYYYVKFKISERDADLSDLTALAEACYKSYSE